MSTARTRRSSAITITFGAFVTMFPQLIAGPIVKYKQVASELEHREYSPEAFARAAELFVVGLSKKVLLANAIGSLWETCPGGGPGRNADGGGRLAGPDRLLLPNLL